MNWIRRSCRSVLHIFHPKHWSVLTWLVIALWIGYAAARNYPYELIENAPVETRFLSQRFADEINEIASETWWPAGWPLFCIRPNRGVSWDVVLYPPPIGVAGINVPRGPRAILHRNFELLNLGLIAINVLAIVYITRTRLPQFSLRTLLFLTVLASVLFVLLKMGVIPNLWQDTGSYIVTVYFAPIVVAVIVPLLRLISPAQLNG